MFSLMMFLLMSPQQRPLPNLARFLEATKTELIHQLDDIELLKGYVYRRRTSHEELGRDGAAKDGEVLEHDVFQFGAGAYAQLISRNGVPALDQELEKQGSGPPFVP